ncbi:ABC transporter permease subunit [Psychromonas aquimarina]|uniref:ABC transporter permease subunit n=1 Tax=Psychromonas aquimarina TaxID=444919 RepID=UPI0004144229|nr:ABC transporter permease subunit [Psychromonas aquimarina]
MLKYLFRRLNLLIITAFILTIIAFMLQHWSSGSIDNRNYFLQYIDYMANIFQGRWGISSIDQRSLLNKGLTAFASTLELCFVACITSIIVAFPLGILAGLKRNGFIDYTIMTIALIGLAIPVFWLAIIMTMLPNAVGISLPVDGNISPVFEVPVISGFVLIDSLLAADQYQMRAFADRAAHLILPAVVLSFFLITEIIRLTRHAITMIMRSNYIKAAYAKGLATKQIVLRHVLKNALPPIIHQIRLQLSTIISFAMTIEIVFSSDGAGVWLLTSIQEGDYLALPAAVLIISGFILLSSILIDILLMIISPTKRKALYADQ